MKISAKVPFDRPDSAFTLIELLMVVAIIAILAAIAIPNMIEAQTRAKVSRVRNDLRVVVTGLEAYRIDNSGYPTYHYVANSRATPGFSFHAGGEATGVNQSPPFNGQNPITTPIAYLTRFPKDAFGAKPILSPPEEADEFYYVNWQYAVQRFPNPVFARLFINQGNWRLHSPGPDGRSPDTEASTGSEIEYDPTNGTTSHGDLLRTQR